MSATIRFPYNRTIPNKGPSEASQIITIAGAKATLPLGGEQDYTDVRIWQRAGERSEVPYECVVLEYSANTAGTIGNGSTQMIGLYGQIDLVDNPTTAADRKRTLIAILGLNLGNQMPQIPIINQAGPASDFVGFSQGLHNIGVYDRLSVGGVFGDIAMPESLLITVVARPIRRKDFLG